MKSTFGLLSRTSRGIDFRPRPDSLPRFLAVHRTPTLQQKKNAKSKSSGMRDTVLLPECVGIDPVPKLYLIGAAQDWPNQYAPRKWDGFVVTVVDTSSMEKGEAYESIIFVQKDANKYQFPKGAYVVSYTNTFTPSAEDDIHFIRYGHSEHGFHDLNDLVDNFESVRELSEFRMQVMKPMLADDGSWKYTADDLGEEEINLLLEKTAENLVNNNKHSSVSVMMVCASTLIVAYKLVAEMVKVGYVRKAATEAHYDSNESREVHNAYKDFLPYPYNDDLLLSRVIPLNGGASA